ncbi:Inositol 2-dehydrogenase [Caulifigura coniformis]|uniref:Inositol 2-dehydrogenase n=1 Tax=Caulifigura coniformis TaxID=2527983 RepID=A0A517SF07_9PLAN|nr:Gfo/Idh/MocA family oxidoreductase [Caulifigura coniformis]QDT54712.1 Inositol 2-dehydrogenase [Caulifigura coniformis]
MTSPLRSSRRNFLKLSAAASTTFAAPLILPRSVFGANERVSVAFIGVGNQGNNNVKDFLKQEIAVTAVCEVDSTRAGAAVDNLKKQGHEAVPFGDYRKLLERKDVDAVVITVPDQWHARMTIDACAAGKDVYCEKPLSLTIRDGRRMVDAARKYGRVVQTGSQQRSAKEFRQACELVRSGAIGKLQTVLAGIPRPNHPGALGPDSDPPATLDYEMWLGPAPYRRYNEKRVHYHFRFWWDYSGGQMTNFGAHHLDIAQWALDMDNSGPIATDGTATFHPEKLHEVTETFRITHTYANGVKVIAGQQQKDIPTGCTFIGDKGKIYVTRGELVAEPEILNSEVTVKLYDSSNHHRNWLDCIKSREKPICDVEIGHRSATVCHLGSIVCRLGRGIQWDPRTEQVIGDTEAQAMTDRPYRKPWTQA